jgi:hypothetical protein
LYFFEADVLPRSGIVFAVSALDNALHFASASAHCPGVQSSLYDSSASYVPSSFFISLQFEL